GKSVIPAPVMPGGPYDGVVQLNGLNAAGAVQYRGTGSLIADGEGHYILTVAHNAPAAGQNAQVVFNLQRDGTPVNVLIPVRPNAAGATAPENQYVINNPTYDNTRGDTFNAVNDIALWKLADPVRPAPDRLLVAPFGAQQYQLYTQTDEVPAP